MARAAVNEGGSNDAARGGRRPADAPQRRGAASARLFVASWPDESVRAALREVCAAWRWPPNAAVVQAHRLHLTLHFIGDWPRERIPALRVALDLPFAGCELTLDTAALWRSGVAVLEASVVPEPLAALHRALGAALRSVGAPLDARRWRPHVTLARRAGTEAPAIAPLVWPLRGFALVESRLAAPPRYDVIANYA